MRSSYNSRNDRGCRAPLLPVRISTSWLLYPSKEENIAPSYSTAYKQQKWLMIRPNLQYVRNPGGVDEVKSAVIIGLKLQFRL
ncbi:carbohydrate porin [Pseudomonas sp. LFS044]|uniref:carbohydrate porin n=1 Tax=Pseudomonas sp. LFS044 TaxID=3229880 RepID=UPI003A813597